MAEVAGGCHPGVDWDHATSRGWRAGGLLRRRLRRSGGPAAGKGRVAFHIPGPRGGSRAGPVAGH
eukprot:663911-Lingulodinium_polyedra.AAC.1